MQCKQVTLNNYLKKWGIEYRGQQGWSKGLVATNYKTAQEYAQTEHPCSHLLLQKLIREGLREYKCEKCGNSEWAGKPIPLELHHKDGNHFNNNFENLEILCPTCHALESKKTIKYTRKPDRREKTKEVYKNKKNNQCKICGTPIFSRSTYCVECGHKILQKTKRPKREELKQLIRTKPFTKIGEMFEVSDNAIRKWCKNYNLPQKRNKIKQYTNEEWPKI